MGPITMAVMGLVLLAILATSLSGNKGSGWACLGFLVSLLGAQVATHFGSIYIMSPFLLIAAVLAFRWKHWIGFAICGLYAVRLAWVAAYGFLGLPAWLFWEFNNLWFVAAQALFGIYGGFMDGGFKHLPSTIRAALFGRDSDAVTSKRGAKGD